MLVVGTFGSPILGYIQDSTIEKQIAAHDAENATKLTDTYAIDDKSSIIVSYEGVNSHKFSTAPDADKQIISDIQDGSAKSALSQAAIHPVIMLICYIGLIFYFRSREGYKPVLLYQK